MPSQQGLPKPIGGGLPPPVPSQQGLPKPIGGGLLPPVPSQQGLPKPIGGGLSPPVPSQQGLPKPIGGGVRLPTPPSTMTVNSPGVLPSSRKKSKRISHTQSRYIYTLIDFGLSAEMTPVGKRRKAVKDKAGVGTSSYIAPELDGREEEERKRLIAHQDNRNTASTYGSVEELTAKYGKDNMFSALALERVDAEKRELFNPSTPNSPHRSDQAGSETDSHTRRGRSGTIESWIAECTEGKQRTLNPSGILGNDDSDDDTISSEDREQGVEDETGDQALYDEKADSFALGSTLYQLIIGNKLNDQDLDGVRTRVHNIFKSTYNNNEIKWEESPHHLILKLIESDKNQR